MKNSAEAKLWYCYLGQKGEVRIYMHFVCICMKRVWKDIEETYNRGDQRGNCKWANGDC